MDERLPEGWAWTTLGMLGEYINGYAFNDELWSKNGRPIIRIQDLTGTRNAPNYYNGELEEKYLVRTGDFLIAWSATLGAYIWHGPEAWLNQHIFKVVSYIDQSFHYYLAQSVISELYQKAHGSGMVHVTRGIFEATSVSLPPLPEQSRIVAAIEQQFTRLDSAVASLQSAKARVKQYRASLLKSAVEGELTREWRAEHPTAETGTQLLARILAERHTRWEEEQLAKMREQPKDDKWKQAYKEPQGPDVENLPELPEGWCWATVEQIASPEPRSIQSGPFGSALLHSEFQESGILAIGIDNVLNGRFSMGNQHRISPEKYEKLKKFTARPLDVLITVMATVGRCCVVPVNLETAIITKHVYRISANQIIISPHFLALCLYGGGEVRNQLFGQVQGQTRPGINGEILKRIAIPVPPLAEQEQIKAEVEAKLSNIAQTEETIEASLKRAEHERQSILQEAFAGRLVPQDPQDEPASVLLERIREERKKREESEKVEKVSRKGSRMGSIKKRQIGQAANGHQEAGLYLYSKLAEAGQPLPPDDLFKRAGLKTDEQPESVEAFYEELHANVEDALIRETRPDNEHVLLEALEPSAEMLARITQSETASQSHEAEEGEKAKDLARPS